MRVVPPPEWAGRPNRCRGRRRQGVLYERRAQGFLTSHWGELYFPSPWLSYLDGGVPRWCQPDGLHFDPREGVCTIVEIKYQHCGLAWRQLSTLYRPVVRRLLPEWELRLLEVVKWFDPSLALPVSPVLHAEPRGEAEGLGVFSWQG